MTTLWPLVTVNPPSGVGRLPAAPDEYAGDLRESARWEWRVGDGGDPAAGLERFLVQNGLLPTDLSRLGVSGSDGARPDVPAHDGASRAPSRGTSGGVPSREPSGRVPSAAGGVCGAAVLISAAAGSAMAGHATGAAAPCAGVPDVAAVVFERAPERAPGRRPTSARVPAAARSPEPDVPWSLGDWRESWTPQRHAAAVSSVREAIARGDVYQVNLVGHASARYRGDPSAALRRVAMLPGATYGGIVTGEGWAVACASPETFVSVRGGRVTTRPIKGTRPMTAAGRVRLLESAKERAEHIMIVDLCRNDLARVARAGSVTVDELYRLRRWCGLWQAESTVSARLTDATGLADVLRALAPAGSVTGAPKHAALDLIAEIEPVGRGPSMGALGWVDHDGVDLGLTIRTVAVDRERVHLWAGGGITWGSDPVAEVAESVAKAAPLRAALRG